MLLLSNKATASWAITGASVVAAVGVDWIINSVVVGVASGVRGGVPVYLSVREQLTSDTDVLTLVTAVRRR